MASSLFDLTGETAVVLGGTGVLGGGMASALAAAGASVAVSAEMKNAGGLESSKSNRRAARRSSSLPTRSIRIRSREARDAIIRQWGSVTILVAAAGGNRPDANVASRQRLLQTVARRMEWCL